MADAMDPVEAVREAVRYYVTESRAEAARIIRASYPRATWVMFLVPAYRPGIRAQVLALHEQDKPIWGYTETNAGALHRVDLVAERLADAYELDPRGFDRPFGKFSALALHLPSALAAADEAAARRLAGHMADLGLYFHDVAHLVDHVGRRDGPVEFAVRLTRRFGERQAWARLSQIAAGPSTSEAVTDTAAHQPYQGDIDVVVTWNEPDPGQRDPDPRVVRDIMGRVRVYDQAVDNTGGPI